MLLIILVLFVQCSSLLGRLRGNVLSKLGAKFDLTSEVSNLNAAPSRPIWERVGRFRPDLQGSTQLQGSSCYTPKIDEPKFLSSE